MRDRETFDLHVDWKKVRDHRKANMLSKRLFREELSDTYGECEYCERKIGYIPLFQCCSNNAHNYGIHGPNVVLFLEITKRILILMTFFSLAYALYALVANVTGTYCHEYERICFNQNIVDFWSIINIFDDELKKTIQNWVWCGISAANICFTLYLRVYTQDLYYYIDEKNITESDYSIFLRELPKNTTPQDIKAMLKQIEADIKSESNQLNSSLEHHDLIHLRKCKQYFQYIEKRLNDKKKGIDAEEQINYESYQLSNSALVFFQEAHCKDEIMKVIKTTKWDHFVRYFFPCYKLKSQYRIKDKNIAIDFAPEPSDLIWSHIGFAGTQRIQKKILYTIFTILVLSVSCGIGYGLAESEIGVSNSTGENQFGSTVYIIFIFMVNASFNLLIDQILRTSTRKEKLDTETEEQIVLMQKFAFYKTINIGFFALITPLLSHLPNLEESLVKMNITVHILVAIGVDIGIGVVVNFFRKYYLIPEKIYQYLIKNQLLWFKYSQKQANMRLQGPAVDFVDHYTFIFRLFLLSLIYSMISPICLIIATIGLFLNYWIEKYFFSCIYVRPSYGGYDLNSELIDLLDVTPLIVGASGFFFKSLMYFFDFQRIPVNELIPIYINLGVGIIHFFIPWGNIIKCIRKRHRKVINQSLDQMKQKGQIEMTYEELNPLNIKNKEEKLEKYDGNTETARSLEALKLSVRRSRK